MRISDWSSDVCSSDLGINFMAGEQSLGDRAILHAGETSVDHPHHLRDTLAALLGYAVVGRDGATADGSPQASDRIEAVGCILIKDHHSHEASAVGRRQVCQVDVERKNTRLNSSH